ncbi:MAG: hypothetical protein RMI79_06345 [Nitrososphaerota archaeon]|nr:hypothetical protein [Nitrososphaerota archaeon]
MGEERKREKDVEELKEVLRTVREEIPELFKNIVGPLKELMGTSLTEEQAREKARAIAAFYKELTSAGIREEVAMEIVKSQFISPVEIIKNMLGRVPQTELKQKAEKKEETE